MTLEWIKSTSAIWRHTCPPLTALVSSYCKLKYPELSDKYYQESDGVAWTTSIPGDNHENETYATCWGQFFWTKARMHTHVWRLFLHSFKCLVLIKDVSRHPLLKPHTNNVLWTNTFHEVGKKLSAQWGHRAKLHAQHLLICQCASTVNMHRWVWQISLQTPTRFF